MLKARRYRVFVLMMSIAFSQSLVTKDIAAQESISPETSDNSREKDSTALNCCKPIEWRKISTTRDLERALFSIDGKFTVPVEVADWLEQSGFSVALLRKLSSADMKKVYGHIGSGYLISGSIPGDEIRMPLSFFQRKTVVGLSVGLVIGSDGQIIRSNATLNHK